MTDMVNPVAVLEAGFSRSLRTACSSLAGFSTNKIRIEPQGQNSNARAGSKISFSLPENSVLSLRSATLVIPKISTTSDLSCVAVPPRCSDLIDNVQFFLGGTALSMNASQYNSIARIVALTNQNLSQKDTTGECENDNPDEQSVFGNIGSFGTTPYVGNAGVSMSMVLNNVLGILSSSSTRYLDTSISGALRVEFLLSPNYNLWYLNNVSGDGSSGNLSDPVMVSDTASNQTYTLNSFYMTCEVISIAGGLYSELLRAKIMEQEFIQINYKDYVSLESNAQDADNNVTRFGASSQSIDAVYCTARASDYRTPPKTGELGVYLVGGLSVGFEREAIPKSMFFQSFNNVPAWVGVTGVPGSEDWTAGGYHLSTQEPVGRLTHQVRVNGIAFPQVPSNERECWLNTNLKDFRQKHDTPGNSIINANAYRDGQFVAYTKLNQDPDSCWDDMETARITGFNSRNLNTMLECDFGGLNDNQKSVFVVAEMTSSVRIGAGKSCVRIP